MICDGDSGGGGVLDDFVWNCDKNGVTEVDEVL